MSRPKVFVAMSGGVDSSVAAALLKERGCDVLGVHLRMWSPPDSYQQTATGYRHNALCQQQHKDRLDAMRVAAGLGIPFQTWNFTAEYRHAVVEYLIREYAAGRTPNPDVMCNSRIKFGVFLQRALASGADYVATGHYVRLIRKSKISNYKLAVARDANKDQSYFLWRLTQDQLGRCLFPVGEYTKPEVRGLARRFGLPTAGKKESQGICFIGELGMREFLRNYIPERPGRVLTTAGRDVGEHQGAEFYTIGQRQGIGIGGGIPYYVAAKDPAENTLTVAEGPYDTALFHGTLITDHPHWLSGAEPRLPLRCKARIRYRQPLQSCWVASDSNRLRVTFDDQQRAVTPGQSVVFYRRGEVLGGAVIAKTG